MHLEEARSTAHYENQHKAFKTVDILEINQLRGGGEGQKRG